MSSLSVRFAIGLVVLLLSTTSRAGVLGEDERKTFDLPEIAPVTLTYRAVDSQNVPYAEGLIRGQLAQRANDATSMTVRQNTDNEGHHIVFGLRAAITPSGSNLVLAYGFHQISSNGLDLGQTIIIPIRIEERNEGGQYLVTLTFPTKASSKRARMYLLGAPELNTSEVLADYAHVVEAIEHTEIQIQTNVHGELDTKYRPEAVLANFDRLIGRERPWKAGASASTGLSDTFLYKGQDFRTTIAVTVFPYRDGSKVQYSANVPLKLAPDGSAKGDDGVKVLQELVAKVAND